MEAFDDDRARVKHIKIANEALDSFNKGQFPKGKAHIIKIAQISTMRFHNLGFGNHGKGLPFGGN